MGQVIQLGEMQAEAATLPPAGFDYSTVEAATATELRASANAIRVVQHKTLAETGRHLRMAKTHLLDHGQFTSWVEAELGMGIRTAQRMMVASLWLEDQHVTVTLLPPEILYKLSAPTTPPDVVDEVCAAAESGKPMSPKEIRVRLDEAGSRRRMAEAEQRKREHKKIHRSKETKEDRILREQEERKRWAAEARRIDEKKAKRREEMMPLAQQWADKLGDGLRGFIALMSNPDDRETLMFSLRRIEAERPRADCDAEDDVEPDDVEPDDVIDHSVASERTSVDDRTGWLEDQSFCLANSAFLTQKQLDKVASIRARGLPSSEDVETLKHYVGIIIRSKKERQLH